MQNSQPKNKIIRVAGEATATIVALIVYAAIIAIVVGLVMWLIYMIGYWLPVPHHR